MLYRMQSKERLNNNPRVLGHCLTVGRSLIRVTRKDGGDMEFLGSPFPSSITHLDREPVECDGCCRSNKWVSLGEDSAYTHTIEEIYNG